VTLGRLALAWLPVAVWFLAVDWGVRRVTTVAQPAAPPWPPDYRRALEALLVTLLASLWFDSLGSGGWWVLFLLVGAIAAGLPRRPAWRAVLVDVGRYVVAGGILAWRLA
jgi:beta-lactamase superfamily II metal-dependent hydrolase